MEPLEPLKPLNHWNMVNMVISADGLLDMLVNIRVKLVILIWFNHIVYYCTLVKRYIFILLHILVKYIQSSSLVSEGSKHCKVVVLFLSYPCPVI